MTTDDSDQYAAWLRAQRTTAGWVAYRHEFPAVPRDHEGSICRLGLPARTENALWRAGVDRISLLLDIVAEERRCWRPPIAGIGDGSWDAIEAALDRPLPPMESSREAMSAK